MKYIKFIVIGLVCFCGLKGRAQEGLGKEFIPLDSLKKYLYCTIDGIPKSFGELEELVNGPEKEKYDSRLWLPSRDIFKMLGEQARNGRWIVTTLLTQGQPPLQANEYEIRGTAPQHCEGRMVTLLMFEHDNPDKIMKVDTACVSAGHFYFHGKKNDRWLSLVSIGNYPERVLHSEVVLEEGIIHLSLDSISRCGGTPLNDSLDYYNQHFSTFDQRKPYILRHLDDAIGRTFFCENANSFNLKELKASGELTETRKVKNAIELEERSGTVLKVWENMSGEHYIDYSLINETGERIKLYQLIRGKKLVFLDIWFSGCAPCIAEMPILYELRQKYYNKGFEVISISTDTSDHDWKRALNKISNPVEIQVRTDEKHTFLRDYSCFGYPHGVLIGEDGCIVMVGNYLRPSNPILENIIEGALCR